MLYGGALEDLETTDMSSFSGAKDCRGKTGFGYRGGDYFMLEVL